MAAFAIIPAAGESRRMGQPKLLLPVAGRALIEHVLAAWRASRVSQIVAVVRATDLALQAICRQAGATVVVPLGAPPEMKDSVALALSEIELKYRPMASDAWLVSPADMPQLSAAVVNQLLEAYPTQNKSVLVPTFSGRRGHPVLFTWPLAAEVAQLAGHEGVNALLKRHAVCEVDCGAGSPPRDLNTPSDYARFLQQFPPPSA